MRQGVCEQANAAVLRDTVDCSARHCGACGKARQGLDFFPLLVDYEERFYSAGKVPEDSSRERDVRPIPRS